MSLFRLFLIAGLSFCLTSCKQQTRIAVVFDSVDGLQVGNSVLHKGIEIGKVNHLSMYHDSILVDIVLRDTIKIPAGSTFRLVHELLGVSSIQVDYSNNQPFLSAADTCIGLYEKRNLLDRLVSDSSNDKRIRQALRKIGEGISELTEVAKDSTNQQTP